MSRSARGLLTTGRPVGHTSFPVDNSERWKCAQLSDAREGIYWGKYGRIEELKAKAALKKETASAG